MLTFWLDWHLWDLWAFPLAVENLLLHVGNVLLLYALAWRHWGSRRAAWWTGFGYSLLFPANIWAVMWISTRAHLLSALFFLLALHVTLSSCRRPGNGAVGVLTAALGALALLSKESGTAVPAGVLLILLCLCPRPLSKRKMLGLVAGPLAVVAAYLPLRSRTGAAGIFSGEGWYRYSFDSSLLLDNLLRTCGQLALPLAFVMATFWLAGRPLSTRRLPLGEVGFSLGLFSATLAPFVFLPNRSGIYTYLPGMAAAFLLGAVVRSLDSPGRPFRLLHPTFSWPAVLAALLRPTFTFGQSGKWRRIAETSTEVLLQMKTHLAAVDPGTVLILTFRERDPENRFPDNFASWGFPYAVRLLYRDSSLEGMLLQSGSQPSSPSSAPEGPVRRFSYRSEGGRPVISPDPQE